MSTGELTHEWLGCEANVPGHVLTLHETKTNALSGTQGCLAAATNERPWFASGGESIANSLLRMRTRETLPRGVGCSLDELEERKSGVEPCYALPRLRAGWFRCGAQTVEKV